MIIIKHRLNTIDQLKSCDKKYGVEVDIRSKGSDLIIHHDPFKEGILFKEWINYYNHNFLILNTKEEGLEKELIRIMNDRKIKDYFFLDQSFPFLLKTAKAGERRCAVRLSEYESISTCITLAGIVEWVWVDYFSTLPIEKDDYKILKKHNFKLCLVSPELQGFNSKEIQSLKSKLSSNEILFDAVCTKVPELWIDL